MLEEYVTFVIGRLILFGRLCGDWFAHQDLVIADSL